MFQPRRVDEFFTNSRHVARRVRRPTEKRQLGSPRRRRHQTLAISCARFLNFFFLDEAEPATHCRRNETDTLLISLFSLLWPAKKLSTWFERKGKFYGMRGNLSFLYNITTQPKNNYPCKSHWDLELPEPGNIEPNGFRITELSPRLGF